ncbi:MAG: LamG domain-containing protein [Planctomycetes bacterium]|nr:LamG domain-containing protein [Planctomycetota bacterium]
MVRRCRTVCPPTLFLFCVLCARLAFCDELPRPVVELAFDGVFTNSGSAGGEATVRVYAGGEGPWLMPGPWGKCLDMTSSSRFGGTIEQKTPAGGAVILSSPAVNGLTRFTLSCWLKTREPEQDVSSRLLTKPGAWEMVFGRGRPCLTLVADNGKVAYRPTFQKRVGFTDWAFLAVVVDGANRKLRYHVGNPRGVFAASEPMELTHPVRQSDEPLEIGNFRGIRPFKGMMDNLRIYDTALPEEQVKRIFESDLANRGKGVSICRLGVPGIGDRKFHPRHSDIMFSTRWQKKKRGEFEVMRDFHATHCLWVYGTDADYVRQVKKLGIFYEGSLNGLVGFKKSGPQPSAEGDTSGRQQNLDGDKTVMTHMLHWKGHPRWEGCHNNPDFRRLFWKDADQLVSIGVDAIHVDDWSMSVAGAQGGRGCFCPACRKGFREYLKRTLSAGELRKLGIDDISSFDYRRFLKTKGGIKDAQDYKKKFRQLPLTPYFIDFQNTGLRDFYASFRKHLDKVSPDKYIPVSVNQQFRRSGRDGSFGAGGYCVDVIDFYIGEPSQTMQAPLDYVHPLKISEALGIPQVTWNKPHDLGTSLAAHATIQALGQWPRVPWDLYMDNDPITRQPAPRYFATKEDWGPFYDFIHDHPHLFDGYESAATVGVLFSLDGAPYGPTQRICKRLMALQAPFCLIPAASRLNRIPLEGKRLRSFPVVVNLSPMESFCEEDQQTLSAARDARATRFLTLEDDIEGVLRKYGLLPVRIEGPKNIYAFLRVKADSAVIHVVNWNTSPEGMTDAFANVTLALDNPPQWGDSIAVAYYRPGQKGSIGLNPEMHRDFIRITLPRLETWGIVEIKM